MVWAVIREFTESEQVEMTGFPKILVIGHARHGKDTVCDILRNKYGFTFASSSEFCAEHIVSPILAPIYGYKTPQECFQDRSNHRAEWFNLIAEYNALDRARLGREIFSKYDIYCGLRNSEEMQTIKQEGLYDIAIWVDAGDRLPQEPSSSNTLTMDMADYVIDNSGSLGHLQEQVAKLMTAVLTHQYFRH